MKRSRSKSISRFLNSSPASNDHASDPFSRTFVVPNQLIGALMHNMAGPGHGRDIFLVSFLNTHFPGACFSLNAPQEPERTLTLTPSGSPEQAALLFTFFEELIANCSELSAQQNGRRLNFTPVLLDLERELIETGTVQRVYSSSDGDAPPTGSDTQKRPRLARAHDSESNRDDEDSPSPRESESDHMDPRTRGQPEDPPARSIVVELPHRTVGYVRSKCGGTGGAGGRKSYDTVLGRFLAEFFPGTTFRANARAAAVRTITFVAAGADPDAVAHRQLSGLRSFFEAVAAQGGSELVFDRLAADLRRDRQGAAGAGAATRARPSVASGARAPERSGGDRGAGGKGTLGGGTAGPTGADGPPKRVPAAATEPAAPAPGRKSGDPPPAASARPTPISWSAGPPPPAVPRVAVTPPPTFHTPPAVPPSQARKEPDLEGHVRVRTRGPRRPTGGTGQHAHVRTPGSATEISSWTGGPGLTLDPRPERAPLGVVGDRSPHGAVAVAPAAAAAAAAAAVSEQAQIDALQQRLAASEAAQAQLMAALTQMRAEEMMRAAQAQMDLCRQMMMAMEGGRGAGAGVPPGPLPAVQLLVPEADREVRVPATRILPTQAQAQFALGGSGPVTGGGQLGHGLGAQGLSAAGLGGAGTTDLQLQLCPAAPLSLELPPGPLPLQGAGLSLGE